MACAYVKSNAVILMKDGVACSIGAGRQNRCDSGRLAGERAEGRSAGVVYASDAFFPLSDGRDGASSAGANTVIQPGCSMGDQKVVDRADEAGRPWSFTGKRHFRHRVIRKAAASVRSASGWPAGCSRPAGPGSSRPRRLPRPHRRPRRPPAGQGSTPTPGRPSRPRRDGRRPARG